MVRFVILLFCLCAQPVLADEFLLNDDGTVADLSSGLIWQGSSIEVQTSEEAIEYCREGSSLDPYAWRLPNRSELENLERQLQTLNLTPYWAGNKNGSGQGIYCLGDGAFFSASVVKKAALVRCVADNPLSPVIGAVRNWVDSWQSGDVEGYLASYEPDFRPRNGLAHDVWKQRRRRRLQAAQEIFINLQTEKIRLLNAQLAEVIVVQSYRSKRYRDRVRKRLLLSQQQGRWLISKEDQLASLPLRSYSATATY